MMVAVLPSPGWWILWWSRRSGWVELWNIFGDFHSFYLVCCSLPVFFLSFENSSLHCKYLAWFDLCAVNEHKLFTYNKSYDDASLCESEGVETGVSLTLVENLPYTSADVFLLDHTGWHFCVCVCVCVCVASVHTLVCVSIHTSGVCVCVCVCVMTHDQHVKCVMGVQHGSLQWNEDGCILAALLIHPCHILDESQAFNNMSTLIKTFSINNSFSLFFFPPSKIQCLYRSGLWKLL